MEQTGEEVEKEEKGEERERQKRGVTRELHTALGCCCSSENKGCMGGFVIDNTDGV